MAGALPTARGAAGPPAPGGRWRAVSAAAVVLAVFAAVVAVVSLQSRDRRRAQILDREGEVLRSVSAMQRLVVAETAEEFGLPVMDEALEVALHTSKMRGVLAVRLFDASGAFADAVPVEVEEGSLDASDLAILLRNEAVVRFHPDFRLASLFLGAAEHAVAPLLEVNVPLAPAASGASFQTFAQYWISGLGVAAEFSRLDREILASAGAAWLAGAMLIAGSLAWAYRRLDRANRLLARRAEDLARANRELAQSARTSAIGAITAHLMHGLRNPVAGLEGFVTSRAAEGNGGGEEWTAARESTRRLRAMIDEVHAVLGDVRDGADFEVSTAEMCADVVRRTEGGARARGIRVEVRGADATALAAREAGIGGLVLANLVHNAIDASPPEGRVLVAVSVDNEHVSFTVSDQGPGLSAEVRRDPFRPRRSTKPNGAGIGLALSHELARHAGGELTFVNSGPEGATFRLRLPAVPVRR